MYRRAEKTAVLALYFTTMLSGCWRGWRAIVWNETVPKQPYSRALSEAEGLFPTTLCCTELMAENHDRIVEVELYRSPPLDDLLEGLRVWQELGIIADDVVHVSLRIDTENPNILAALETGLQLGLTNHWRIEYMAANYLCCPLPEPEVTPVVLEKKEPEVTAAAKTLAPAPKPKPSWRSQRLSALKAELSVRWLLFLGLFLVVLGSGVFAASQWNNFPAVGQYGVLLAYTGLFGFISSIADRRENLKLTAGALKLVALLLIPVNFWAMDDFGLWSHPLNIAVSVGAAIYLTAIARSLWTPSQQFPFPFFNYLILGYLHWGWGISQWPILAIYLAIIGSLGFYYRQFRQSDISLRESLKISRLSLYAIAVLLFRALFVAGVSAIDLSLAIALCGTFMIWLAQTRSSQRQKTLNQSGIAILFIAWFISIWDYFPWQGIVISLLTIRVFYAFLNRYGQWQNLVIIWSIGAQLSLLLWNCIPWEQQEELLRLAIAITHAQMYPSALLSFVGLPYVIWMVNTGDRLYQKSRPKLALFAELSALALGIGLLVLALPISILRIWCFTNFVFLIIWVTKRRYDLDILDSFPVLVYLNHLTGLGLILSFINYTNPELSGDIWGMSILVIVVAEFWFAQVWQFPSERPYTKIWKESAWNLGIGLAAIAYLCFLNNVQANLFSPVYLSWLVVPATLTLVSYSPACAQRKNAVELSIISSFAAQYLLWEAPGWRVLGLAIAVIIAIFNTRQFPSPKTAAIAVPFALATIGLGLWDFVVILPHEIDSIWLIVGAIATAGLWGLRSYALRQDNGHYAIAFDFWAITLCLLVISFHGLWIGYGNITADSLSVASAILISGAITYRSWFPSREPTAIGWSVVVILTSILPTLGAPSLRCISLAIATLLIIYQTRFLPRLTLAAISVGLGLLAELFILLDWIDISSDLSWIVGSANVLGLWIGAQQLQLGNRRRQRLLTQLYRYSLDGWAIILSVFWLIVSTIHSILVYHRWSEPTASVFVSLVLLVAAMGFRIGYSYPTMLERSLAVESRIDNPLPFFPTHSIVFKNSNRLFNWGIFGIGWTLELLVVESLASFDGVRINLAVANLILGLCAQLLGNWWQHRTQQDNLIVAWHAVPLVYGILGAWFRATSFASWTGLTTLMLALILLGVGRRSQKLKPLTYLAIFGITACAYEVLFYQLAQQSGGATGDGLIVMGTLGTSILYGYRLLKRLVRHYFQLTAREYQWTCHLHWFGSSLLLIMATFSPIDTGMSLGFATGMLLVFYALSQGRHVSRLKRGELWVSIGFIQALGMRIYWLNTPVARLIGGPLVAWKGAIVTLFAYFLYFLPWQTWGWSPRPWKFVGIILPLYAIAENPGIMNQASLSIIAAYYIGLAIANRQIRFTYLSLGVINWMLWRWLSEFGITEGFWYFLPLSLVLLFIVQVEPYLKTSERKQTRHYLRTAICTSIGLASFSAEQWIGTITGLISLLGIFVGLSLKTRAFLYVGTGIFLLNVFYQLGILIFDYPFSKWLVALGVGISLIWIAATFETRREQIQAWFQELQYWE